MDLGRQLAGPGLVSWRPSASLVGFAGVRPTGSWAGAIKVGPLGLWVPAPISVDRAVREGLAVISKHTGDI